MRISHAQPIFSGKKGGMTRPVQKPYTYLPPPSVCSNIFIPAWKRWNCIWERGNPLYARQSLAYEFLFARTARIFAALRQKAQKLALFLEFPLSQTLSLSQHRLGLPPQDPAFACVTAPCAAYRVFMRKTRACFSKNFFNVSKALCPGFKSAGAHFFTEAFSAFWRTPKLSRGTFLGFVRVRMAHLAHFWGKCGRILPSRRVFGESASAHCLPGAISEKVQAHIAFLARFWGECGCILLSRRIFGESAGAFCFPEAFWGEVQAHFAFLACF